MDMQPAVSYILYDISSRGKNGDIITFAQFEEVNLLPETRKKMVSCNKYDDNSTLEQLFSEELMDAISLGDEFDAEPMSTEM